jgi:hypothetical protein
MPVLLAALQQFGKRYTQSWLNVRRTVNQLEEISLAHATNHLVVAVAAVCPCC